MEEIPGVVFEVLAKCHGGVVHSIALPTTVERLSRTDLFCMMALRVKCMCTSYSLGHP